jgi:hypothetical protein
MLLQMMAYRYNRSVSARNPKMPDSGNQRIAASGNTGVLKKRLIAACVTIIGLFGVATFTSVHAIKATTFAVVQR